MTLEVANIPSSKETDQFKFKQKIFFCFVFDQSLEDIGMLHVHFSVKKNMQHNLCVSNKYVFLKVNVLQTLLGKKNHMQYVFVCVTYRFN